MIKRSEPNVRRHDLHTALALTALAASALLWGCGEEPPPPPPPVVQDAPPPPPPPPNPADLMKKYNIDTHIVIAADEVPVDEENPALAEKKLVAVLQFFDAMVRGSDEKVKPMMSSEDQAVLAGLVKRKMWADATKGITKATLGCGQGKVGLAMKDCCLAVIETGGTFQPQLWTFELRDDGQPTFSSVPCPPGMMEKLSGIKAGPRIKQWLDTTVAELALAAKPDEDVQLPQRDVSEKDKEGNPESGGDAPAPSSPGQAPSGPGKKPVGPGNVPPPRGPGLNPGGG